LKSIYEKIADWLVPALLAAAVYFVAGIQKELGSMSVSLAIAVTTIDEHERRLGALEAESRYESQGSLPGMRRGPVQRPQKAGP
jgi:hypothetical protein